MSLWQKILTGLGYTAIAAWMAAAILGEFGMCSMGYVNILAAIHQPQPDDFEVRSRLLMEAMNDVGVCCPEDASEIFAEGLKNRSAALQYAVMNARLKNEYARQLSKTAPNWVTGISSPYVSAYKMVSKETVSSVLQRITLRFSMATSTGPAGEAQAVLHIAKEGSYWRIIKIDADEALFPYTRFIQADQNETFH